jgi:hypothetical protein
MSEIEFIEGVTAMILSIWSAALVVLSWRVGVNWQRLRNERRDLRKLWTKWRSGRSEQNQDLN